MDKKDLKIVFLGTPEFAVESLDRIVTNGFNVAAVVTMPDKIAGRGHKLIQSPVKDYAVAHGLPVLQPEKLKDPGFVARLQEINADLFIVIAFRMLPEVVWRMPRLGTFNLHASLLPRYRGAAPINWAIINGDTYTGVTTFFLRHEIDTGDIIRQERIGIGPDETLESVYNHLMRLGADLTIDTIENILSGNLHLLPQESLLKGEAPTPAPKIFRDTCRIDWTRTQSDVHNLVRGLSPYPAAWSTLLHAGKHLDVKIISTARTDIGTNLKPGKVLVRDGHLFVGTADSPVEILTLKPEGKKAMPAADFLRGTDISADSFI